MQHLLHFITDERLAEMHTALNRAANTWEDAPAWVIEMVMNHMELEEWFYPPVYIMKDDCVGKRLAKSEPAALTWQPTTVQEWDDSRFEYAEHGKTVVSWADGAKSELYKLTLPKIGTKS